jgi:enoyl-CoA hydratase/carnithine racemase
VRWQEFLVDPSRLDDGWTGLDRPLMLVELERMTARPRTLPPIPVIGIGDPGHDFAAALDAVVEPPVTVEAIVEAVQANPRAAGVAVTLLRALDIGDLDRALTAESLAYGLLQGSGEHAAWLASLPEALAQAEGEVQATRDGDVLHIRLDRPQALNAIDRVMRDSLHELFTLAALDEDIRTVRLTGEGRAFSMGADLSEFGTTRDPAVAHLIRMQTLPARAIIGCADKFEAHVHGGCVGAGLEMAALARRITASQSAWFQLPELAMGIIPGAGGCVSLTRRIGRQRAALMILSGRRINVRTALDWGLVDAIVDDPAVDESRAHADG